MSKGVRIAQRWVSWRLLALTALGLGAGALREVGDVQTDSVALLQIAGSLTRTDARTESQTRNPWLGQLGLSLARSTVSDATVLFDLVVERHCEKMDWLRNITSELRQRIHLIVYDKSGKDCQAAKASEYPENLFNVTLVRLPNIGRDGHTQLYHITNRYGQLAPFTAFVQAGLHWTLRGLHDGKHFGWPSQADALNDVLPRLAVSSTRFLPLTFYTRLGPVLYQDREDSTDPDFPPEANAAKFGNGWADLYNRAREMYSLLFGGTPCEAEAQRFTPGMQYIIARENIRARPRTFYQQLLEDLPKCEPHFGYVLERLTTAIFNSSAPAQQDTRVAERAVFCNKSLNWTVFTTPLKREETHQFWQEHWGCDPRSERWKQRLLQRGRGVGGNATSLGS